MAPQRLIVHRNFDGNADFNIHFNSPYLKKFTVTPENLICCCMLAYPNCFSIYQPNSVFKKVMAPLKTDCAQKF